MYMTGAEQQRSLLSERSRLLDQVPGSGSGSSRRRRGRASFVSGRRARGAQHRQVTRGRRRQRGRAVVVVEKRERSRRAPPSPPSPSSSPPPPPPPPSSLAVTHPTPSLTSHLMALCNPTLSDDLLVVG
ncbi:uncharacterized protein LOC131480964 isoform X3 [Ochotona princeps]|uniref:uncharacterized protein LOC131480964 isoform X3 n=1 Tax=Ochotona princeps TaxID=9978 RepID=UPI0027146DB6|nr:uncharacterized protein LOC131480964 isoform X3 [Ochotona princeps]